LVLKTGMDENGIAFFEMEYARGEKFSDLFPNLSIKGIDNIILKLLDYFNSSFEKSSLSSPDSRVIHDKIIEVETKVKAMPQFDEKLKSNLFEYLSNQIPQSKLPLSYCHGDFTFSNMLFDDSGQVYIFDFLDSFIESPIIDIVKLRQDTRFYWSVEIDENLQNHKVLKVLQVLNYIDHKIESYLQTLSFDCREWYQYLEIINLARIMPYAKKDTDYKFLNKNLTQLLNKI
jgi:aminoglycoside phosphotransferase (APT) family kinase protein